VTDPDHARLGQDEFLTLRLGGSEARPERLLLIGRPREGVVRVREWHSGSWNTEGEDYELEPADLLAQLGLAMQARVEVSEELHRVKRWLEG
jgi:hypothetical protein